MNNRPIAYEATALPLCYRAMQGVRRDSNPRCTLSMPVHTPPIRTGALPLCYLPINGLGGQGRIRTFEAVRQRIYSPPLLTTQPPAHRGWGIGVTPLCDFRRARFVRPLIAGLLSPFVCGIQRKQSADVFGVTPTRECGGAPGSRTPNTWFLRPASLPVGVVLLVAPARIGMRGMIRQGSGRGGRARTCSTGSQSPVP